MDTSKIKPFNHCIFEWPTLCISNGFYVDYLHYAAEKFVHQCQLLQCNCCDYDHGATSCKRQPRCGKCGEKHNSRECQSTTAHCFQCKSSHEAWHPKCPARIAEKDRLNWWEILPVFLTSLSTFLMGTWDKEIGINKNHISQSIRMLESQTVSPVGEML